MSVAPADTATTATTNANIPDDQLVILADGKVKKRILKEGNGKKPTDRSQVFVHYTGRLLDGTVFDSSKTRNQPFDFKLGTGQVIKGWDVGVASMSVGEHAILTCAPDYAYGASGSPPKIPANATLEFEVELLSFDNKQIVTEDKGVMKSIQTAGEGYNKPNDNATVTIKYQGRVDERVFDGSNGEVTLKVDELPLTFPPGFEDALKNMLKGEKSIFYIKSDKYGFGAAGCAQFGINGGDELIYEVEMVDFQKGRETFEMSVEEKVAYMTHIKERGNFFFKNGQLERALNKYVKCVKVIQYDGDLSADQKSAVNAVKLSCYSNATIVDMKLHNYQKVLVHCNEALALNPQHFKSLYHRGLAQLELGQYGEAERDLKSAAEIDPSNADAKKQLMRVKAKLKAESEKEKKAFGGFFGKVRLVSPEEEAAAAQAAKEAAMTSDREWSESESDNEEEADKEGDNANMTDEKVQDGTAVKEDQSMDTNAEVPAQAS